MKSALSCWRITACLVSIILAQASWRCRTANAWASGRTFRRPSHRPGRQRSTHLLQSQQNFISPLKHAVDSIQRTSSKHNLSANFTESALVDAAAIMTQEACRLLGVKCIGVDYGLMRTGIAVSVGYEPKPLEIVQTNESAVVCDRVIRHARIEQASSVVVGLPLHKNGTVAEQTNLTLAFAQELAVRALAELGPSVTLVVWDERYTSKEAAARAHSRDPDRYLYGTLDAEAACIILEHYYYDNGVGGLPITVVDEAMRRVCLDMYEARQRKEQLKKIDMLAERERKLQRRKDAIAQARELEQAGAMEQSGGQAKIRKKRKKKR